MPERIGIACTRYSDGDLINGLSRNRTVKLIAQVRHPRDLRPVLDQGKVVGVDTRSELLETDAHAKRPGLSVEPGPGTR